MENKTILNFENSGPALFIPHKLINSGLWYVVCCIYSTEAYNMKKYFEVLTTFCYITSLFKL